MQMKGVKFKDKMVKSMSVFTLADKLGVFFLKNPGFSANADWFNVEEGGV